MTTSTSLDRRLVRTVTVALVASSLVLPSASALAAPSPPTADTQASVTRAPDTAVARSRALFEQGLEAYEADDYATAVQYWTQAHDLMLQTPELTASRHVLGFDLAQAQMRAYDGDNDTSRIAAAKPLLERFVAWVDRPEHTMDVGERQDRMHATELLERIASESSPPTPVPPPEFVRPPAAAIQAPSPPAQKPSGTGLLVGGGLALAGSVAGTISAIAITTRASAAQDRFVAAQETDDPAERDAAARDGRLANIGVVTSMTSAVLLGAAGVTMLAIGARRRKRHVTASAALTPSMAAASVSFRF